MIGAKAIALPFFEFLAPYKPGQPLYLIPERAALLCLAEVIVARDSDTGEEMPVWGTDAYERAESRRIRLVRADACRGVELCK